MSGGDSRCGLGRALIGDPELLVLDEPTLGLAPVIIDDISDAIETLNEQGQTLLLVEQNATFALRHAHRLSLLESGRVELVAPHSVPGQRLHHGGVRRYPLLGRLDLTVDELRPRVRRRLAL